MSDRGAKSDRLCQQVRRGIELLRELRFTFFRWLEVESEGTAGGAFLDDAPYQVLTAEGTLSINFLGRGGYNCWFKSDGAVDRDNWQSSEPYDLDQYEELLFSGWAYDTGLAINSEYPSKAEWLVGDPGDANRLEDIAARIEEALLPVTRREGVGRIASEAIRRARNGKPRWRPCRVEWTYIMQLDEQIKDLESALKWLAVGDKKPKMGSMPPEYVQLAKQIADKLDDWADPKDDTGLRHEYVGHLKPISIALEGFDEVLEWLHLNRPEAGEFIQRQYDGLISNAKLDDHLLESFYKGDEIFSVGSASGLAWALRSTIEMLEGTAVPEPIVAGEDTESPEKSLKDIPKQFEFRTGQALFRDRDLNVGTGAALEILQKLVEDFNAVVPFQKLDPNSDKREASEKIRTAIRRLRMLIKTEGIPVEIKSKKAEGYVMLTLEDTQMQ